MWSSEKNYQNENNLNCQNSGHKDVLNDFLKQLRCQQQTDKQLSSQWKIVPPLKITHTHTVEATQMFIKGWMEN